MAVLYSFLLLLLRKRTKKNKRIKDFQNEYSYDVIDFFFFLIATTTPSIAEQEKKETLSHIVALVYGAI